MGLFWQEDIINFFHNVRFSSGNQTPASCYLELARKIRENLTHLHEYFGRLASAMEIWIDLWDQCEKGQLNLKPSRQQRPNTVQ